MRKIEVYIACVGCRRKDGYMCKKNTTTEFDHWSQWTTLEEHDLRKRCWQHCEASHPGQATWEDVLSWPVLEWDPNTKIPNYVRQPAAVFEHASSCAWSRRKRKRSRSTVSDRSVPLQDALHDTSSASSGGAPAAPPPPPPWRPVPLLMAIDQVITEELLPAFRKVSEMLETWHETFGKKPRLL